MVDASSLRHQVLRCTLRIAVHVENNTATCYVPAPAGGICETHNDAQFPHTRSVAAAQAAVQTAAQAVH